MTDIRIYTRIIIKKNGKYLVGTEMISRKLKWSDSPYDAWYTRKRDKAYIVADKVKGIRYLFNPVVCQVRPMRIGTMNVTEPQ